MANNNSLATMRLPQAQFQPATFNPVVYEAKSFNPNVLLQNMAQYEAKQERLGENEAAFNENISKLRSLVHEDEKEWVEDYINRLSSDYKNAIDRGEYTNAIKLSKIAGSKVLSTDEAMGRIKANEEYKKAIEEVDNNNSYDSLTKQRFKAVNNYYYDPNNPWKPIFNPVADIDIANTQALASQFTAEEAGKSGGGSSSILAGADGKTTKDASNATGVIGHTTGSTTEWHKKEAEKMERVWNRLLIEDPKLAAGLEQKYETLRWALDDREAKAQDLTIPESQREAFAREAEIYRQQLTDNDGIIPDALTWAKATAMPMFKDMAYNNQFKTNGSTIYDDSYYNGKRNQALQQDLNSRYIQYIGSTFGQGASIMVNGLPGHVPTIEEFEASLVSQK